MHLVQGCVEPDLVAHLHVILVRGCHESKAGKILETSDRQ
jgi:hypothetical protein